jgi:geranylgeranyl diphosphate synthase type I
VRRLATSEGSDPTAVAWYSEYRGLASARLRALLDPFDHDVYALCRYHLGWIDEQGAATGVDSGKMLRPVLCLTACSGFGDPGPAVGVAAALELLHAFSLVHDDIEDGDRERRHRPTLWARFGVPLALNAGDALFAHAYRALYEGLSELGRREASLGAGIFSDACLKMIEGQHLDIDFETRASVSPAEYTLMTRGKTGALIGAALALGALCGGAGDERVEQLRQAGVDLGLAFQATDDALAFWGDPAETGKAVGNDLQRGKQSLPLVLAVERGLTLERLRSMPLAQVQDALERTGSREATAGFARERAEAARRQLAEAGLAPAAEAKLVSLVDFAVSRVS